MLDERVQARRAHNAAYREALAEIPGLTFMPFPQYGQPNAWLTCVQVSPAQFGATREDLRLALEREDIEARPVWKQKAMRGAARFPRPFSKGGCACRVGLR